MCCRRNRLDVHDRAEVVRLLHHDARVFGQVFGQAFDRVSTFLDDLEGRCGPDIEPGEPPEKYDP